jgi:hypothetical protein
VPPGQGENKQDNHGCVHFALLPIGVIVFFVGGIVLLSGLAGNPDGSAIRQAVLAQHMTNGILLMILGVLIAKR